MEESHKRSRSETLYCYVSHDDVRSGIQLRKLHYHEERHHLRHFCGRTANAQFRFQAVHQNSSREQHPHDHRYDCSISLVFTWGSKRPGPEILCHYAGLYISPTQIPERIQEAVSHDIDQITARRRHYAKRKTTKTSHSNSTCSASS